jgi:hypothetical protein
MSLDQKAIIKQIDDVLSRCKETDRDDQETATAYAMVVSAIRRLSPPGSTYAATVDGHEHSLSHHQRGTMYMEFEAAIGTLRGLRNEYEAGYLQSVVELVHADVFADFLEMADYLLRQGYKDPAAVVAGSVLEAHLRKLCLKNSIDVLKADGLPKKADALNSGLSSANVYSKLDQKGVTHWLGLRNDAAHGNYNAYTKEQVESMIDQVRDFVVRHSA